MGLIRTARNLVIVAGMGIGGSVVERKWLAPEHSGGEERTKPFETEFSYGSEAEWWAEDQGAPDRIVEEIAGHGASDPIRLKTTEAYRTPVVGDIGDGEIEGSENWWIAGAGAVTVVAGVAASALGAGRAAKTGSVMARLAGPVVLGLGAAGTAVLGQLALRDESHTRTGMSDWHVEATSE